LEILIESPEVIYQRIYYSWNAISNDPDDNKFFDVAVAGGARYLVTNDAHFNEAKNLRFPHVTIITVSCHSCRRRALLIASETINEHFDEKTAYLK
jgi:predicted nucleic acid-binding protein